jgi:pimeloyl-ACP methyl ester carboxylesterase
MRTLDKRPEASDWGHARARGSGDVELHYVRRGEGDPVVLLHGWPGFWYDWRHVIQALAESAAVIAPDFRGFGESDKPDLPPAEGYTPAVLADDVLALPDRLGLERVVLAGHDIGATVAQRLALGAPERIGALAVFNPPYPGIGERRFEPGAQREFWYQHFHNLPWSHQLVAHDRETIRIYLAHFYEHWCGREDAVRPTEFEAIVDAYAAPDAFKASIAYYRARAGQRSAQAEADPRASRIEAPTVILWGERDPVIPSAWSDRLAGTFPNHELDLLPDVGHFVPFEAPEETLAAIQRALERSQSIE